MLIDVHSHVDMYDIVDECSLESAIAEIDQHKIFTISNSIDLVSYRRNMEISKMCSRVLPIFGVHPWKAPQYTEDLEYLTEFVEQSPMIGEIGLDHYFVKDTSVYPIQKKVFEFFLSEAVRHEKIVILHMKGAEKEVLELLEQYDISRVIVHWYSGPLDIFRKLIARKVFFSVGIEVLHSAHIQAIAREIPSRQLLTETDNPIGPKGFIGRSGMPVIVKEVVRGVAKAKKSTVESIVETVRANFAELIRDDPWLKDTRIKMLEDSKKVG